MNIKILSDSSCDLTAELLKQYDIDILKIQLADENGEDTDVSIEEMFRLQKEGHVFQTAQIGIYPYVQKFQELAEEGRDFIYLSLSSGLSGGYNNSKMALEQIKKEYPHVKMATIDTLSASVGQGLFVYHMAKAASNGMAFEDLLELADFLQQNICLNFTVLDMEHLYRGGRVSRAKKSISRVLNLMPILKVDSQGKLYVYEVIRGKHKVNKRMMEMMKEDIQGRSMKEDTIFPVFGEDRGLVENLETMIEEFGAKEVSTMRIGTIIGTHVGPEVMGCAYLKNALPEKFHEQEK